MRKIMLIVGLSLLVLLLLTTTASAGDPHFAQAKVTGISAEDGVFKGSIAVDFKIVGALPGNAYWVGLYGYAVAVYTGGAVWEGQFGSGRAFWPNKQGQIKGTAIFMLDVPPPGSSLLSVTYTNLGIEIHGMDVSRDIRGTFTRTF